MVVATANDNWQNSSENGACRQTIAFLSAGPDKEQNQMASSFFGDRWLASLSSTVFGCLLTLLMTFGTVSAEEMKWVVYPPGDGPGKGRSIVLISGDEEYRSEETLPALGKILAKHHGFHCTVLFAINPKTGEINPNQSDNIPGLEALKTADLMVIFTRFRNLHDEQMKHVADYVDSGKPMIGLRTSTHAFNIPADRKYARYGFRSKEWPAGFGKQVLGETWVSHHGHHGKESTRGILAPGAGSHPIVKGIEDGDIWGPTDVYGVRLPLDKPSNPLVLGQVVGGMKSTDPAVNGKKNDPMMPVAWTRTYKTPSGKSARVFTSTMGAAQDFESEGLRKLLVQACYWCVGLENKIDGKTKVDLVGDFKTPAFGFNAFRKGIKPANHAW